MHYAWNAPGPHAAEFGAGCGLAWYFGYLGFYPVIFKRKMRKLYREQELSLPWTIELSQEDIHSMILGRSDTLQWVFFNSFVETDEMFTLLKKQRPVFLTIAKENLQPEEQDELGSLLLAKLGPAL